MINLKRDFKHFTLVVKVKLIVFILILFFGCNNLNNQSKQTEKEFDILKEVIESSKYGATELGILAIDKIPNDNFRIWRFPEGGTVFEEMYELNLTSKTFKMHSYLIQNLTEKDRIEYAVIFNSNLIFNYLIRAAYFRHSNYK